MPEAQTADIARVKLNGVRLSYPHLHVPKAQEVGKEPKYSATFLLDKTQHKADIAKIEKLIERLVLDKFKKKVPLKHKCLHDGNEKAELDGYGDEVMFIPTTADRPPAVIDGQRAPITQQTSAQCYAGCYVNVLIRLYAWEHPTGGRGVSAGLMAVQFAKDGESFGAAPVDVEKEFDLITMDDPAF